MDAAGRDLLLRYFDDELSRDEVEALREHLRADPSGVEMLVLLARREAMLVELVRTGGETLAIPNSAVSDISVAGLFRRWAVPLAAAASAAAIIGTFTFSRAERGLTGRVTRQAGRVSVSETGVATGPGSICRLDYSDGTIVAVDQNASVGMIDDHDPSRRTLDHQAGRIYVELGKQDRLFTVKSGMLATEVMGTRLILNASGQGAVTVLDGEVKVKGHADSAVRVKAGRSVTAAPFGLKGCLGLQVRREPPIEADLAWLAGLGLDVRRLLPDPSTFAPSPGAALDDRQYQVLGGTWCVSTQADGALALSQEEMRDRARVLLGEPRWKQGVVSFDFRFRRAGPGAAVGVSFIDPSFSSVLFASSGAVRSLLAPGATEWLRLRVEFEVQPDDTVIARKYEVARLEPTGERIVQRETNWSMGENPVARGGVRGIGIECFDSSVEYRNVKIENGVTGRAQAGRVTDGLLAFYRFNEGAGETVLDTAGEGAPLNLTIGQPDRATWSPRRGLVVHGDAQVASEASRKLADAVRESGGMTAEIWCRIGADKVPAKSYALLDMVWPNGWFNYTQGYPSNVPANYLMQSVFTLTRRGNDVVMSSYENGRFQREKRLPGVGKALVEQPATLRLPGGGPEGRDPKTFPWTGEYLSLAIYGRALNGSEVWQNYRLGLPESAGFGKWPEELLGLYTFKGGRGSTVGNRIPAGRSGVVTITRPDLARWTPTGLHVQPGAEVKWVDRSGVLAQSWSGNRGLAFELWFRFVGPPPTTTQSCVYAHIGAGPFRMTFASPRLPGADSETLRCGTYSVNWEDGKAVARFYADGKLQHAGEVGNFGALLSMPVELCVAPSVSPDAVAAPLTGFEICRAAIHGRALSEDEVRQRVAKGLTE